MPTHPMGSNDFMSLFLQFVIGLVDKCHQYIQQFDCYLAHKVTRDNSYRSLQHITSLQRNISVAKWYEIPSVHHYR